MPLEVPRGSLSARVFGDQTQLLAILSQIRDILRGVSVGLPGPEGPQGPIAPNAGLLYPNGIPHWWSALSFLYGTPLVMESVRVRYLTRDRNYIFEEIAGGYFFKDFRPARAVALDALDTEFGFTADGSAYEMPTGMSVELEAPAYVNPSSVQSTIGFVVAMEYRGNLDSLSPYFFYLVPEVGNAFHYRHFILNRRHFLYVRELRQGNVVRAFFLVEQLGWANYPNFAPSARNSIWQYFSPSGNFNKIMNVNVTGSSFSVSETSITLSSLASDRNIPYFNSSVLLSRDLQVTDDYLLGDRYFENVV